MKISGSTELYAVLGNPVRHSMSPVLQNAWIQAHGFNALYVALPVELENFEAALQGLAASDVCGLNITTPFKERAAEAALRQSDRVKLVGAANCLSLDRAGRGSPAESKQGGSGSTSPRRTCFADRTFFCIRADSRCIVMNSCKVSNGQA